MCCYICKEIRKEGKFVDTSMDNGNMTLSIEKSDYGCYMIIARRTDIYAYLWESCIYCPQCGRELNGDEE